MGVIIVEKIEERRERRKGRSEDELEPSPSSSFVSDSLSISSFEFSRDMLLKGLGIAYEPGRKKGRRGKWGIVVEGGMSSTSFRRGRERAAAEAKRLVAEGEQSDTVQDRNERKR